MGLLFNDFASWKEYCIKNDAPLYVPVLDYEKDQKGRSEAEIWKGLNNAYSVMRNAVETGLSEDMSSRSGMINNCA